MQEREYRASEFAKRVDELGIAAVKARDTEDYLSAYRKLYEYIKKNYFEYHVKEKSWHDKALWIEYQNMLNGKTDDILSDEIEILYIEYYALLENLDSILKKVINRFDFGKIGKSDVPFFSYIKKDLEGTATEGYNNYSTQNNSLNSNEEDLLERIKSFCASMDYPLLSKKGVKIISEKFNISEKKIRKICELGAFSFMSIDDVQYDNEGNQLDNSILDSNTNIELEAEGHEAFVINKESGRSLMLFLNKLYRDHFNEKQKLVFPRWYTNNFINSTIATTKRNNCSNDERINYKNNEWFISEYWDNIKIPYWHKELAKPEYLCIDGYIFEWFERIRRIILDKEIAEYLGISSSNFIKIRDKLIDFVWEKFEEVYKREQE
jgi:hypothetical protein